MSRIMLFDDWSAENAGPWKGHPFHADNNVNGIDGDPNHDGLGLEFHSPGAGWKELARVNGVLKKSAYEQGYPHVVFCDGKILCRNMEGELVCLSVRKAE